VNVLEIKDLEALIDELKEVRHRIADRTVRWEVMHIPQSEVAIQVGVWATAICRKDGSDTSSEEYLIEFGRPVGVDDLEITESDGGGPVGTNNAAAMRAKLLEACDDLGLKLRPGKIEVF
jgi:hypothetical protein